MSSISPAAVYTDLQAIRQRAPLVHNITNFVVMQQTANALLALGASPIMAHAAEEIIDIIKIANSLVINIGTLDKQWINSMRKAVTAASIKNIPIIIDPVGAGATPLRTQTVHELLAIAPPAVIRGNASEILALTSTQQTTKGVDSTHDSKEVISIAKQLAQENNCVVVVSGATDICISAQQEIHVHNGHALMTKVTGMGCTATTLIGAFCAINTNALAAAAHATIVMGITGELAAQKAQGPGTLPQYFLDILYSLTEKTIQQNMRAVYA